MKKMKMFAIVVAGALCFGPSLPVYAADITGSRFIIDKIDITTSAIADETFSEKIIQQDQISDQLSGKVRLSPIDERILENSSPIVYVLTNVELGEPIQKPETNEEIDKEADGELGDPLQKPDSEESDNEPDEPIQKPETNEESAEPEVTEESPAPAPGGESERVAYVQIMRYYFGMAEKSLEEYAEYLRTEEGWNNEEWLQHILSLAFPDEYNTAPEPQPVPDDELEIVY